MKNSLLLVSVLIGLTCSAQLEKVIDGLEGPMGIAFDDDKLFVAESMGGKVSYFYVHDQFPTTNIALQGLEYPVGLTISSDKIIVAELGSLFSVPRVLSASINEIGIGAPIKVVVDYLNTPSGLAFANNDVFIADFDDGKVLKVNTNSIKPPILDVLVDLAGPSDIIIQGKYLYLAERTSGMISRKDIYERDFNDKLVLISKLDSPEGVTINGKYLYFSSHNNKLISRIDISNGQTAVVEKVVEVNESGARLAFHDDVLYISQNYEGAIYKFKSEALAVEKKQMEDIVLFPNPASEFITIQGLTISDDIQIVNLNGTAVMHINAENRSRANISHLPSGVYFIRVSNERMIKLLKR